tara:strand:- start:5564 stop:7132 length:1569 start_codon:yes stop_codon:yes gene_type:complete
MDLKEIRDEIFSQADWAPSQSSDAVTRTNRFINRAYAQIAQEAPFLFFESQLGFATLADVTDNTAAVREANPASAADTVSVIATDPWVLRRNLPTTTAGIVPWDVTGRWRGREIVVTDPGGVQHRRKIRDIWTDTNVQYISLYRPWNNLADTLMSWRIYSTDYYLPDDIIEVTSLRLFQNNQTWPLDILGQLEAEHLSLANTPSQVAQGVPRSAYRRPHQQIESPTKTPTTALGSANTWLGPEPAGQFEYCFTYIWGYRDGDFRDYGPSQPYSAAQTAPSRLEPLWESSPSPVVSVTTSNRVEDPVVYNGAAISIITPDIDYMQGFGRTADTRYRHSGWRKRIYRRRITVDPTNYGALTNTLAGAVEQETPDAFYLIADIDGFQTTFIDNGQIVPDYHRRLREVNGYQALRMYPRPNQRYEVDVRCVRRPPKLKDDSDAPKIHPDALSLIVYRSLCFLYEAQGNVDLSDRARTQYQDLLFTLTKRYGDLRYPAELLLKKPARAGKVINTRRPWRRWYNLPNN